MKAVVIGGGIAGLVAARVLSESHDVVVLERDKLSDEPEYRAGVPQGRHVHGLLVRGGEVLEDLFPGLLDELVAAGAYLRDASEMRMLNAVGWIKTGHTGLPFLTVGRPLLETAIRRRVNAKIQDDTAVVGLSFNGSTVDGVLTKDGRIDADLVVDASGRASKIGKWLGEAGVATPEPTVVDSRTGYATRLYDVPAEADLPVLMAELLSAPARPRGAIMMRIEGGRVMMTAQGAGGDHPPRDEEGYRAFLESLEAPFIEMLKDFEPVTPVYLFARTASRRNAFEQAEGWPGGLVALGDSVCAFNPVYGQGMTIAALEALELRKLKDFSAKSCRGFQRAVAKQAAGAWSLSSGADLGWTGVTHAPGPLERFQGWYMRKWFVAITYDPELFKRFFKVIHMMASPASLMNPLLFRRLAKYSRPGPHQERRPAGSSPR
ncbi:FAD-dependent monooxygenase [Lentzea sp. NPDC005914]|uniref:FAD-dependent oxidoreductase n=1 Tax=Lentzea sp. NPDC005914 TaxID=3154572 RepID=UPI0033CB7E26